MEDLNSPELKQWIAVENAITFTYLNSLPARDALKSRITELYDYPRVTAPKFVGGRWYYNHNTGLQRQAVVFTRETLNSPETVVIDPNQLSPDGSTALPFFDPARDGRHRAYGQSELDAPVRPLYLGHTASYDPLGVVNGTLYVLTDLDAPNKKIVSVRVDRPDLRNWKTIVPQAKNAIESARLLAGKLAVNALVDV